MKCPVSFLINGYNCLKNLYLKINGIIILLIFAYVFSSWGQHYSADLNLFEDGITAAIAECRPEFRGLQGKLKPPRQVRSFPIPAPNLFLVYVQYKTRKCEFVDTLFHENCRRHFPADMCAFKGFLGPLGSKLFSIIFNYIQFLRIFNLESQGMRIPGRICPNVRLFQHKLLGSNHSYESPSSIHW